MPPRATLARKHNPVRFVSRNNMASGSNGFSSFPSGPSSVSEAKLVELLEDKARIEELSDASDDDEQLWADVPEEIDPGFRGHPFPGNHLKPKRPTTLPPWLTMNANLFDRDFQTDTSNKQQEVMKQCLPFLTGEDTQGLELNSYGIPKLRRFKHISFLEEVMGPMPAPYVAVDASRPWLFYWALQGLCTLGVDVRHYKDRLMSTLRPLQNPTGGFGGGHGQLSHCAGTYAAVLSLAMVDGLDMVDRDAMWRWLGRMKQANGGFTMALGAEEDIRGAYCGMTVITLLNLPLELPPDSPARQAGHTSFLDDLGSWISRCQSYEGGIAGAPDNEAHGAYAFCALACLSIIGAPHRSITQYLDVQALLRWMAGIQTSPEGGFAGRTNKLVDACYSHWVGGCWALLQAAFEGYGPKGGEAKIVDLWNREGLIRYLLCCCQATNKKGGMRDKPSTRADGYHTCYSLNGLSAAQNHYAYVETPESEQQHPGSEELRELPAAFNWTATKPTHSEKKSWLLDDGDLVAFVHPVFVLPMETVERTRAKFAKGNL